MFRSAVLLSKENYKLLIETDWDSCKFDSKLDATHRLTSNHNPECNDRLKVVAECPPQSKSQRQTF